MGLTLPTQGVVCLDTAPLIYAVEKISPYHQLLSPLWEENTSFSLAGSELLLLETLVKPIQQGDTKLQHLFRQLLNAREMNLLPITTAVLELAVQLRATANLKTPDAIHAATALTVDCQLFVTNDSAFRRVPNLPVTVLKELI